MHQSNEMIRKEKRKEKKRKEKEIKEKRREEEKVRMEHDGIMMTARMMERE